MNKPIDITGLSLKTDRLTLRPFQDCDLQDLFAYARVDGVGEAAGWCDIPSIILGSPHFVREIETVPKNSYTSRTSNMVVTKHCKLLSRSVIYNFRYSISVVHFTRVFGGEFRIVLLDSRKHICYSINSSSVSTGQRRVFSQDTVA